MCSYSMNSPTMRVRELEEEVRELKGELNKLKQERTTLFYTNIITKIKLSLLKKKIPYKLDIEGDKC